MSLITTPEQQLLLSPLALASSLTLMSSLALMSCNHDISDHAGAHSTDATLECAESSVGCFDPAWEVMGDHITVALTDSLPSLPERGSNAWRVQLARAGAQGGEALAGCSINVTPYMPEHGHGVPLAPRVTDEGAGSYHVEEINFTMPGLWELRFEIECDSSEIMIQDELVYAFWLDS